MMQLALGHSLSRLCNEYERHEMRRICRILKRFKGIVISDPLLYPVRPDWAIYCTLGNFSKPVQQLFFPNCSLFDNSCKGVEIFHFYI